jgi:predicted ATP-grasp superfamily ATP-dependent carboligase
MAKTETRRVVIAGVSTRALSVSAARAGYQVTAIDPFGDLDLRAVARVKALRRDNGAEFSPLAAAKVAEGIPKSMIVYTSNFENYPTAVGRLARHHRMLGNSPAVLRQVRDPLAVMRLLRREGFVTPTSRATAPSFPTEAAWLLKPRRSGGGHGTLRWRFGKSIRRTHYLQERIVGSPGSIAFAANAGGAMPLGVSRQIVGDSAFGASGFRYCGSLYAAVTELFPRGEELLETAVRLASALTEHFGLVGLNGIDFVARRGIPYPIEVNPRYSASMELIERAHGLSMFETHAEACQGRLPTPQHPAAAVEGKAIVFARRDVTLGNTRPWLQHDSFADVPHSGEQIRRGHPICTVFARAGDTAACYKLLTRRAAEVYRLGVPTRRSAA